MISVSVNWRSKVAIVLHDRRVVNAAWLLLPWASFSIFVLKCWPRISNPILWGEDGSIFLQNAIDKPVFESLFTPYAGYFHFIPNLIAEFSTLFPIQGAPLVFAVSYVALVAILYVIIAFLFETRIAKFAAYLIIPLSQGAPEIYATVTNFQWLFAIYAFELMTRKFRRVDFFFLALALFSGPFALIAIVARVAARLAVWVFEHTLKWVIIVLILVLISKVPVLSDIFVVALGSFGTFFADGAGIPHTQQVLVGGCLAGLLVLLFIKGDWIVRYLLMCVAIQFFLVGIKFAPEQFLVAHGGGGGRYFFLPQFLLLFATLWFYRDASSLWARYSPALLASLLVLGNLSSSMGLIRISENSWPDQMRRYEQCLITDVSIYPPHWTVDLASLNLTCDD